MLSRYFFGDRMNKSILLALSVALISSFNLAQAAATQKQYTLKGSAPTGTMIKTIDVTSSIPFNKRYHQLSQVEKDKFRAKYDRISSTETPPFPSSGMQAIYRPIIAEHKKLVGKGTLSMLAVVDETGKVESLSVSQSPSARMSELSASVLRNTRFDPAQCAGTPCKMEFPVELTFH